MSRRSSTAPSGGGRVLHLDAFSGVAGNMFLGALLDAGLPRRALEADLAGLGIEHRLRVRRVKRGALAALYLDVLVPEGAAARRGRARRWVSVDPPSAPGRAAARVATAHEHGTARMHARAHPHGHATPHEHAHVHRISAHSVRTAHASQPSAHASGHAHAGRRFSEIRTLLRRAKLVAEVRDRALDIFEALAQAEARVHRTSVDAVHFHEVGAVDALIDVVGAAAALHRLGVSRVSCSAVALGHGMAEMDHGRLPLPAPAVLELLRGVPTVPAHAAFETVTPTGAAILRSVVEEWGPMPALIPESIGHGAGRDRPGPVPNVLRAVLGSAAGLARDRVVVLETNLDDLVPEHFDFVLERLFEAGALDVGLQHQQMKKNRPGFALRVLARPSDRQSVARVLLTETGSLGVRVLEMDRFVLPREQVRVRTPYGAISVKRVTTPNGQIDPSAEYDDCKRAARRHGVPLREVVRAAEDAARRRT